MLPALDNLCGSDRLQHMKEVYYKIQYFDKISMAYMDIQKKYLSINELFKDVNLSKNWRIMVIDGKDRHPMLPSSLQE